MHPGADKPSSTELKSQGRERPLAENCCREPGESQKGEEESALGKMYFHGELHRSRGDFTKRKRSVS